MIDEKNKYFTANFNFSIPNLPVYYSAEFNPQNVDFAINKPKLEREKMFLQHMPIGLLGGERHGFAVNGMESSRYLKLFDPWGGVYDVDISEDLKGFKYVARATDMGANELQSVGGRSEKFFARIVSDYVPVDNNTPRGCVVNGVSVRNGDSITTYENREIRCVDSKSSIRKCLDGILSSGYPYVTCQKDCSFNGILVQHGKAIKTFEKQFASDCSTVKTEQRICNNGILQGSYYFDSCRIPKSCQFQGKTIDHGSSLLTYETDVALDCSKAEKNKMCIDGVVSGGGNFLSCRAAKSCRLDQDVILHGQTVTAFSEFKSLFCNTRNRQRTCRDGLLDGDNAFKYSSCRK